MAAVVVIGPGQQHSSYSVTGQETEPVVGQTFDF